MELADFSTRSYCSNLPFSFEDADLKKIFANFEVTSAYVAVRRNGRSKGFGELCRGAGEMRERWRELTGF